MKIPSVGAYGTGNDPPPKVVEEFIQDGNIRRLFGRITFGLESGDEAYRRMMPMLPFTKQVFTCVCVCARTHQHNFAKY